MVIPLKHPQEIEVWYVLPAIRRELAVLLRARGISQKAVAHMLGITESAVSQYINQKRAKELVFPDEVREFIREASVLIVDERSAYKQVQLISKFIKDSKALCKVHMGLESGLAGCDICYK